MISSAVTRTAWIRGSVLTTVFMPCLQNVGVMYLDDPPNDVQFACAEAVAARQPERLKPELACPALPLDVHMWRLATVEAGEEEPVWAGYTGDSWHSDGSLHNETIPHHTLAALKYPSNAIAERPAQDVRE